MNAPADLIRLTQFSHGGGCGCKIAPAVLSEILAKTPIRGLPKDLLVGIESSIVGMPLEKLPVEVIQKIVSGGESVCAQAGIPVAGGHSIDTLEPIYGLVALGLVHPEKVKRNDRAQSGDVLILGKPLGVGILSAALKKGKLSAAGYKEMVDTTWAGCSSRAQRRPKSRCLRNSRRQGFPMPAASG